MHNADIPLRHLPVGAFLLLGYDPLLDEEVALHIFCEPVPVLAIRRGRDFDVGAFLAGGGTIVLAAGFDEPTGREISVEVGARDGGRVLVRYPDDRHLVGGVNLPGEPLSTRQPGDPPLAGRLVWADGWRIEYG